MYGGEREEGEESHCEVHPAEGESTEPFSNFSQWLGSIVSSSTPSEYSAIVPSSSSSVRQCPSSDVMSDLTLLLNNRILSQPNLGFNIQASEAQRTSAASCPINCDDSDMIATVPRLADLAHSNQILGDGHMYCVFVWNLPPNFTEDELNFYFAPFGEMAENVVETNLARTDNQRYAIIRYRAYASGRNAVLCMNGLVINQHRLAVVLYYPTRPQRPLPRLSVANFPHSSSSI